MADVAFSDLQELATIAHEDLFMLTDDSESVSEKSKCAKAETIAAYIMPPGSVIAYMGATAPYGYLECDGSAVSRSTYAGLFNIIGVMYGAGDASTTFNLPDLRGRFLRAWDHGAGVDPNAATRTARADGTAGDAVGTTQADAFEEHTHRMKRSGHIGYNDTLTKQGRTSSWATDGGIIEATGGDETRPVNINVMYCIKY